jgi:hypothetical protein
MLEKQIRRADDFCHGHQNKQYLNLELERWLNIRMLAAIGILRLASRRRGGVAG